MKAALRTITLGLCLALPVFGAGDVDHNAINWLELTAQILNASLFFGILTYLLKDFVKEFFTGRLAKIKEDLDMAARSREEAKARLDELESKMANLDQELAGIEQQARKDAEHAKETILAQAQQDAERILTQAVAEVENLKRESVAQLKAYVADLAVEKAESLIVEKLDEDGHKQLFSEFVGRLGAKS